MDQIAIGLKDASAALGISVWTLRKLIRTGKLRTVRFCRRVLITPEELQNLMESKPAT